MGFWDCVLNVATLGGHGCLKDASERYTTQYQKYRSTYDEIEICGAKLNHTLYHIGKTTKNAVRTLRTAQAMLMPLNTQVRTIAMTVSTSSPGIVSIPPRAGFDSGNVVLANFQSAVAAAGGLGVGSVTAVGAWSLVSLVGTASTGTAISSLTGVAAYNATLAWFGGGAIAAGGAGMAGGAMALSGILLIPMIALATISTYKRAADIEKHIPPLIVETEKLEIHLVARKNALETADAQYFRLEQAKTDFDAKVNYVRSRLFPIPFLTRAWRRIRSWCGGGYYQPRDWPVLDQLDHAVHNFAQLFTLE